MEIDVTDSLPLAGLKVYDASQGVAGPYCSLLLALNGAEVTKVEPPEGDWGRALGELKGALTARENLEFWSAALKRGGGLDPLQALAAVNLAHVADLPVGWLSAGQRRRTALARLLVAERPLWLLDEPTTALDAASQARLAQSMAAHRAKGGMIIAATHAPVGLEDAAELRLGAAS